MSRAAAALGLLLTGCAGVTVVPSTYPGDRAIWERLVSDPERLALLARPVTAVAPHHLIDGFELAAFWKALAEAAPAPMVVVIGPDHRAQSGGEVAVGDKLAFETVFGALEPDPSLVAGLRGLAPVITHDAAFPTEHSIHAHAPFIKRFFPGARFLPLIVRWGSAPKTLEAVAQALHRLLPPDALVVASVDFSHFQAEPWATFHDEASWASLAGFETEALFELEADSPESLFIAMRFAALRGARRVTQVLHTNSQRRRSVFVPDSTSHFYATFTRGEPAPEPAVSVMLTGEVAASTGLGLRQGWRWHPYQAAEVPAEPRLSALRGQEDRFFVGADAFLFRLEPGIRVERTIHRTLAAFAAVSLREVSDPVATVTALKGSAACLFLLAIRDAEPVELAADRLRALADAGADVVVGRGFGAPTELEYRGGRVVALSLGPFLTDERSDGQGAALGATWTPAGVRARTVPLVIERGVPRLDLARLADELGYPPANGQPAGRE